MNNNNLKNKLSNRAGILPLLIITTLLYGCIGVDSNNDVLSSPNNEEVVEPDPVAESEGLSALSTQGTNWVNAENEPVILKGTNLGNWLLHEFWMMNQSSNTVATDQCTLEETLDERFGFNERERLLDMFRDNWIAERDWDLMQDFGLNVIRLPFIWNVIEDENNPMTLRDDAWQYIDYAIEQAEARDMYIILDLHGAVGAQGWADHSGCAGQNLYWSTPEFQERTVWLWQQIAERYKDNATVAAYGLLNEPWGTDSPYMAEVMLELYADVREVDSEKIIVLPGYYYGIDDYGHPEDFNGTNVAFEMHFYPGIFGNGDPTYETHRDWLACGEDGQSGVCEWAAKMESLSSPLLVGEFQPWANMGYEFGAENTRATYDKFAEFGWAATNWSFKVLNASGGQGNGTWGMVTNQPSGLGLVSKASTWVCPSWDSAFEDACDVAAEPIIPTTPGTQTYYLVVKLGTCCEGALDISVDELSLKDNSGNELILNGSFGEQGSWTTWAVSGVANMDFNTTENVFLPTNAQGAVFRVTGKTNADMAEINGGIYQEISLDGDAEYTFSGVFKDNASTNAWAEVYLISVAPIDGMDILAEESLPSVDFNNAPIEDIEAIFTTYGTVEYEVHQPLLSALTRSEPSTLFSLPSAPTGLEILVDESSITLTWSANLETDVTGYNLYRSIDNNTSYQLIAENISDLSYIDTTIDSSHIYYYSVAAVDEQDISYNSNEVVSGVLVLEIPGQLEAESWGDMSGFELELTSDVDGGYNTGFADLGDWLEYTIDVSTAGEYIIEYRLATETGSDGFTVSIDGVVIDTVVIEATGGWQTWATQTSSVVLSEGPQTFRLDAAGGSWNLNWIKFSN